MASHGYMTITGKEQGLISKGCSTPSSIGNKCQSGHTDEIMVLAFNHRMTNIGNIRHATHGPIQITKNIDKASPLLAMAMANREKVNCIINFYRVSDEGPHEKYYTIQIEDCEIAELMVQVPHAVLENQIEPVEQMALRYQTIRWTHHLANTSGYAFWGNEE